ncbi:MAG: type II TA system antitoxin MqsA family protein [Limisphaerales bacterium]
MNAPKPRESLAGQTCPCCQQGHFALVQIDHTEPVADDNPITVPGVWVERCDHCGEIVFPGETTRFIESAVAEQTEQLSPRELERIREDLGVATQDEMSEVLGLGLKTFHKWESGRQFPTRSMSCYIRVLADVPGAFDFLRRRAWRAKNRVTTPPAEADLAAMFPDLAANPPQSPRKTTTGAPRSRMNPALGLTRVAFSLK